MPTPTLEHLERRLSRALGRPARVAAFEPRAPWSVGRATLTDGAPGTLVVKWLREQPHGLRADPRTDPRQLATEAAALEFLDEIGWASAPKLLGAADDLVVLEDLAPRRALDETLVERGMAANKPALLAYARTLGELGARTAGRAAHYDMIRARRGPADPAARDRGLGPEWPGFVPRLEAEGMSPPPAAASELVAIQAALASPGPFLTFSNGDPQVNNFLAGGDGEGRLIDFEFASYRHALTSAALINVPGSAWVALAGRFDLELEAVYRTALAAGIPEASDDALFGRGLAAASLAWACDRLTRLALLDARPAGDQSRVQMVSTLEAAAAVARRHRQWPQAAGWAERTAAALRRRWPDADVDLAALAPYTPRR